LARGMAFRWMMEKPLAVSLEDARAARRERAAHEAKIQVFGELRDHLVSQQIRRLTI